MSSPLVSLCIPTYNSAHLLPYTLASITQQTSDDFEVIVCDNASEDCTESYMRGMILRRLTYHRHHTNIGFAANLNTCLRLASGRYVTFVCADDEIAPDFVERMASAMESKPSLALVHCNFSCIGPDGEVLWSVRPRWSAETAGRDFFRVMCQQRGGIVLTAVMARRELLTRLGGFQEELAYSCDIAMWLRLSLQGDVGYLPDPLVRYRIHPGNLTKQIGIEGLMSRENVIFSQVLLSWPEIRELEGWTTLALAFSRDEAVSTIRTLHWIQGKRRHRRVLAAVLSAVRRHPPVLFSPLLLARVVGNLLFSPSFLEKLKRAAKWRQS